VSVEFVHLHVHTQFSFLVSTVKLAELSPRVKELGMPAVALTDHANMFGAVRHWKLARSAGIQPILGCELNVARDEQRGEVDHLVVLAATNEGYRHLIQLVSAGYTDPASDSAPSVTLEQIAASSKGLIGLTGCLGGVAAQQVLEYGPERGEAMLGRLRDVFEAGHLFVELSNHGLPE
jgi:DNA polymerase-3 subunit alpha